MAIKLVNTLFESPEGEGSIVACSDQVDLELSNIQEALQEFNENNTLICEEVTVNQYVNTTGHSAKEEMESECCNGSGKDTFACLDRIGEEITTALQVCELKTTVRDDCYTLYDVWSDFVLILEERANTFDTCRVPQDAISSQCIFYLESWRSSRDALVSYFKDFYDETPSICAEIDLDIDSLVTETRTILEEDMGCSGSPSGQSTSGSSTITPFNLEP